MGRRGGSSRWHDAAAFRCSGTRHDPYAAEIVQVRTPAVELITELSDVAVADGVEPLGEVAVDSCGTAASRGSDWGPKDRGLRCMDSYAAAFLIPGETDAVVAGAKIDEFLRMNGLVPNEALATNPVVLDMPTGESLSSVTVGATREGDEGYDRRAPAIAETPRL